MAQTVGDIINFFQDEPPIFQAAEGQVDGINGIGLGSMGNTFSQLAAACVQAQAAAFLEFDVSIDLAASALAFRLIHPLDAAPAFNDQTFPSLFQPLIGVSQVQIKAGDGWESPTPTLPAHYGEPGPDVERHDFRADRAV